MKNDNRNFDFDRFSFRRVGMLLNKRYVTTRRSLLLQIAVIVGIMLLGVLSCIGLEYMSQDTLGQLSEEPYDFWSSGGSAIMLFIAYLLILSFGTVIAASMTFGGIRTKAERSITLMMPANVGERMLADSVFSIFLPPIVITVVYLLAECLRTFLAHMFFSYDMSLFTLLQKLFMHDSVWEVGLIGIGGIVMQQAFYLLGSVVWPRLSFLKTFAALQILGYLMLTIIVIILFITDDWYGDLDINGAWLFFAGSIMFAVASAIIAYHRYRQIEIIQRW